MQHELPYEYWRALAALGEQATFNGFDDFNDIQMFGSYNFV